MDVGMLLKRQPDGHAAAVFDGAYQHHWDAAKQNGCAKGRCQQL
jgi:hypothetical protein